MVANVVPQKPGSLEFFDTVRTAITGGFVLVLARGVTLQVLQLEIADIRAQLAGEHLAALQLVDRMLAEDVLGQVPHPGETGPAESAQRDCLGDLLQLQDLLIDGKLVLELDNVAVLQDVVLVELVLSHERFLTKCTEHD